MISCWQKNTKERPSFKFIVEIFDDIIVDSIIDDKIGQDLWKREFRGQVCTLLSQF